MACSQPPVERLQVLYFRFVSLKGDMKFIVQSLNLARHAGREEAPRNLLARLSGQVL